MLDALMVGLGGFCGSIARHLVGAAVQGASRAAVFPVGTTVINLSGCLLIGFLSQWAEARRFLSAAGRSFLFIGILGGYTTFSTFGNETMNLLRSGDHGLAAVNLAVQVLGGLLFVWLGRLASGLLWR